MSIHFYAKAHFYKDWDYYVTWLKKKATNNYKKICFEDEAATAKPIRDHIVTVIETYEKNKAEYPKRD